MTFLEKHKAIEIDRQPGPDPLARAKQKLIAGLTRQIENLRTPGQVMHRGKPVSEWWFHHDDGAVYTHIRFGMRPIEFPTGKAFRVGEKDDLIGFYQEVISAIEAGELNEVIEASRKIGARRRGHGGFGRRHGRSGERGKGRDRDAGKAETHAENE